MFSDLRKHHVPSWYPSSRHDRYQRSILTARDWHSAFFYILCLAMRNNVTDYTFQKATKSELGKTDLNLFDSR